MIIVVAIRPSRLLAHSAIEFRMFFAPLSGQWTGYLLLRTEAVTLSKIARAYTGGTKYNVSIETGAQALFSFRLFPRDRRRTSFIGKKHIRYVSDGSYARLPFCVRDYFRRSIFAFNALSPRALWRRRT